MFSRGKTVDILTLFLLNSSSQYWGLDSLSTFHRLDFKEVLICCVEMIFSLISLSSRPEVTHLMS